MTGLKSILEQIRQEAEAAKHEQTQQARTAAAEKCRQAEEAAKQRMMDAEAEAENCAKDILRRAESAAALEANKQELVKKQEWMNRTLKTAYQRLMNLTDEEYEEFVLGRLKTVSKDTTGILRFVPRNGELASKSLRKELKSTHPGLVIAEQGIEGDGGFVLDLGEIEENNTFRTLFEAYEDELKDRVQALLFS